MPPSGVDDLRPPAEWWRVFNHTYTVIYRGDGPVVHAILGEDLDDRAMWSAPATARGRWNGPRDPFAWFNLGSDLVALEQYERPPPRSTGRQTACPGGCLVPVHALPGLTISSATGSGGPGRHTRVTTHLEGCTTGAAWASWRWGTRRRVPGLPARLNLKPDFPPAARRRELGG